MATTPNYASTPKGYLAKLSVANTNKDGTTGTYAELVPVSTDNVRIDDITVQAQATTTAGMIRLFLVETSGASTNLLEEWAVTAVTPSATVPGWGVKVVNQALVIPAGWSLKLSTEKAELFSVSVTRAAAF